MAEETKKKDVSVDDGNLIVAEAATWKGTPYLLNGPASMKGAGGDCSGSTQKIYSAANCPYEFQMTGTFPAYAIQSGLFRELGAGEAKQEGDLLSWSSHMAIYSSFANDPDDATTARVTNGQKWTQHNDMWTAWHTDGPAYSPAKLGYFRPEPPRVFRYQK